MKKILNTVKWTFIGQIIGIVCLFTSFFVPMNETLKGCLFNFGIIVILGYLLQLYTNVYKPLKKEK